MNRKATRRKEFFRAALGAALVILCGLLLWKMPYGQSWVNTSYDYLFRFISSPSTNRVILIQLDNEAYAHFDQRRGQPWDRALHAQLLNRLGDDGCALVVFDSFFRAPRDPVSDEALAAAMRRQRGVVLMAEQALVTHPALDGARPIPPADIFLQAATNWGVAWVTPDLDSVVRRQWPFPSPGPYPSLPWKVAELAGAKLDGHPRERWLRYYGRTGPWTELSYRFALDQPGNFYRDAIVFIGSHPKTSRPGDDDFDEFSSPYTRWTGVSTGGVEILIISFLNLLNGGWLERPPDWQEILVLIITGAFLGGWSGRLSIFKGMGAMLLFMLGFSLAAICLSHFTNRWFPWLVVVGGQVPCALVWALLTKYRQAVELTKTVVFPKPPVSRPELLLETPGYELFPTPFGEGAYGKVFLARNESKKWEALKVVYLAKFDKNTDPYDREFKGVNHYHPLSTQHPGLLRVNFVSEKKNGYFYYVMELGDAIEPGWESDPTIYKPRDLMNVREHLPGKRLPALDCISVGITLCDALEFLHQRGFTHRDIKPQNVIFVNGQPRLADVGLVAEIRPDQERTVVGTPGYMPPAPEIPGTPQADIYSLGMVLYVLSTGGTAARFPEISSTMIESRTRAEFHAVNSVILKACQIDPAQRYATVEEMRTALKVAEGKLKTVDSGGGDGKK
ncbi:MAG: CHASE2 domain-containing protein [Akkermansiaceae bacterium]|nr:CHASE2 domain-containing protein [Verrucomicrobiales bacterium]